MSDVWDELDWEDASMKFRLEDLMKSLDVNKDGLVRFMVRTIEDLVNQVRRGRAIVISDHMGKITGIYNIPINIKMVELGFNYSVSDFLGFVIAKENQRFGRIVKIEEHDWQEYGLYYVTFGDGSREEFPDNKPEIFKTYFRKPYILNPGTNPTYEEFRMNFFNMGCDEQQLREDYRKLFSEELPTLRRSVSLD